MKHYLKKIKKRLLRPKNQAVIPKKSYLDKLLENGLTIGDHFNMLEGCMIDFSHCWHIRIGNHVTLAPRVHILAHDASTKMHLNYAKIKNVAIGNYVFIGAGSIIMPGVTIGDQVIVGAGSVVTKSIPSNSVYAGNPAKFICNTNEYIENQKKEMNDGNTFNSEYTLAEDVSDAMKAKLIQSIDTHGVAFVE